MIPFRMHFLFSKKKFEYYVTTFLSINDFNLLTFTNLYSDFTATCLKLDQEMFYVFATLFALDSHLFPFNFSEHSHRQELVCERCPQVHRHKNLPACPLLNLIHP